VEQVGLCMNSGGFQLLYLYYSTIINSIQKQKLSFRYTAAFLMRTIVGNFNKENNFENFKNPVFAINDVRMTCRQYKWHSIIQYGLASICKSFVGIHQLFPEILTAGTFHPLTTSPR
jgi:inner membrane protein involved in colicin E2 resistance